MATNAKIRNSDSVKQLKLFTHNTLYSRYANNTEWMGEFPDNQIVTNYKISKGWQKK